jgi:hypothetical protein
MSAGHSFFEESSHVAMGDSQKEGKSTAKKRRARRFLFFFLRALRFFAVDFPQDFSKNKRTVGDGSQIRGPNLKSIYALAH